MQRTMRRMSYASLSPFSTQSSMKRTCSKYSSQYAKLISRQVQKLVPKIQYKASWVPHCRKGCILNNACALSAATPLNLMTMHILIGSVGNVANLSLDSYFDRRSLSSSAFYQPSESAVNIHLQCLRLCGNKLESFRLVLSAHLCLMIYALGWFTFADAVNAYARLHAF